MIATTWFIAFISHTLTIIDCLTTMMCGLVNPSSMYNVQYLLFKGEEGQKFNTIFECNKY